MLVRARLGDVVADGVGLAGVGDAAGAALPLGHRGKLAVHGRARQGPAVYLPLLWSSWDRNTDQESRKMSKMIPTNTPFLSQGLTSYSCKDIFLSTYICMLEAVSALDGKSKLPRKCRRAEQPSASYGGFFFSP